MNHSWEATNLAVVGRWLNERFNICTGTLLYKMIQIQDILKVDPSSVVSTHKCVHYIEIEDIYSFAVNTINIVIGCNENISIFTSAKHE